MSKKTWKPYVERLRSDPEDTDALDALEGYLVEQGARGSKRATGVASSASRYVFKMFLGKQLYNAVVACWDAWSAFFYGEYESSTRSPWPEAETRDMSAAVAARFLRIGMFGILIGLIPAIMLGFQTALMIIQVWQVNVQNEIITEQNALTREQFAVGYRAQFIEQLYGYEEEKLTVGNESFTVCKSRVLPHVVAEAVTSLAKLERIIDEGSAQNKKEEPSKEGAKPHRGPTLDAACLAKVELDLLDLSGSSLERTIFHEAKLEEVKFDGAKMTDTVFHAARLDKVSFDGASMKGVRFGKAHISNSSMKGATLLGPHFEGANLVSIDFTDARFYPHDKPVLRDRDAKANFSKSAALKKLNFTRANLIYAHFAERALIDVTFDEANLTGTNFIDAALTKVSFKEADLSKAKFAGARLTDVDFTGAKVSFKGNAPAFFKNVTCPNGKNSDKQGKTCKE